MPEELIPCSANPESLCGSENGIKSPGSESHYQSPYLQLTNYQPIPCPSCLCGTPSLWDTRENHVKGQR